jgi:hypothetical protein
MNAYNLLVDFAPADSAIACQLVCQQNAKCNAWTYIASFQDQCGQFSAASYSPNTYGRPMTSGPKFC